MLHLKTSLVVGSNRADLASLLKRFDKILIICNGRILNQWQRSMERFGIGAEFMRTQDFLGNGIQLETKFEVIVVEDYPHSLHAPRPDYDGMSMMNQLIEHAQSQNADVIEIT